MALTQETLRLKYAAFYEQFHLMHAELVVNGLGHRGHGPDHDMLVAGYCLLIAGDDHRLAEMAWVAAHLHSLDRFFGDAHEKVTRGMLDTTIGILGYDEPMIAKDPICGIEKEEASVVLDAVLRHGRPNEDDDSSTLVVLKDADRLANVMPYVIARSGQFQPNLPVVELGHTGFDKHPETTYRSPRSIHDDLLGCLEWHPDSGTKFAIRTQKGREIGEELFAFLRDWFALSDKHMKLAGL